MLGKRVPTNLLPNGGLKLNTKVIICFDFLERIGTIVDMNFLETNQETWKIFRIYYSTSTWQLSSPVPHGNYPSQVGENHIFTCISEDLFHCIWPWLHTAEPPCTRRTYEVDLPTKKQVFVEGFCDGRGLLWTISPTWFSIVLGWTSRLKNWTVTSSILRKAQAIKNHTILTSPPGT